MNKPVQYFKHEGPEGVSYYIFEPLQEICGKPIAKCFNESTAEAICNSINGSNMTVKELDYRRFIMKLQQQRAEAGVENKDMLSSTLTFLLTHGAMGMVTESAEIMDIIKKHLVYRRPLDTTKLKDECGDVLFYLTMVLIECGSNYNEIINMNIAKLTARYKGKYSHEAANIRDLEAEKKAQETASKLIGNAYHQTDKMAIEILEAEKKTQMEAAAKNEAQVIVDAVNEAQPVKREEPPIVRDEKA